jgi:hypothetical protein
VPTETSVSIDAAPWRRLVTAARWIGKAPHTATGAASASDAHCHDSNCHDGTIAIATTGSVSAVHTRSRMRSAARSGSVSGSSSSAGAGSADGGSGSAAVYPAFSTAVTRSSAVTDPAWRADAFSVA